MSGGLRFPTCPKEDALVAAFKDYGAKSRVPNLWIYAKNDSFFGSDAGRADAERRFSTAAAT